MVTKTDAYPDVAIAPGEFLLEEIEARGFSQKELAKRMGRPMNTINEIINGRKLSQWRPPFNLRKSCRRYRLVSGLIWKQITN